MTKQHLLTLVELRAYCKEHGIIIPPQSARSACEAAIVRAATNGLDPKPDAQIGCFGYYDESDGNCISCIYQDDCSEATLGMKKDIYNKFIERDLRLRISYKPMLKKSAKKRTARKK